MGKKDKEKNHLSNKAHSNDEKNMYEKTSSSEVKNTSGKRRINVGKKTSAGDPPRGKTNTSERNSIRVKADASERKSIRGNADISERKISRRKADVSESKTPRGKADAIEGKRPNVKTNATEEKSSRRKTETSEGRSSRGKTVSSERKSSRGKTVSSEGSSSRGKTVSSERKGARGTANTGKGKRTTRMTHASRGNRSNGKTSTGKGKQPIDRTTKRNNTKADTPRMIEGAPRMMEGSPRMIEGILAANERGFGFVERENEEKGVYISADNMNGAIHSDTVLAEIINGGDELGRIEGRVVKIIEQGVTTIVGTLKRVEDEYFAIPDNKKFCFVVEVPKEDLNDAREGQKVLVEITDRFGFQNSEISDLIGNYSDDSVWSTFPLGKVIEVIGFIGDPGVDVLAIIKSHGFSTEFPKKVMKEADAINDIVSEKDIKGRRDLRGQRLITIDGADSKDLDDAVSIEPLVEGGYRLGVHIADVSAYVKEGSALDKEARERGTSLYFVDRVLPMLPQKLSNGICSLHPNVNRLALSVLIDIDANGRVKDFEMFESVIKTTERMTYENVHKILEQDDKELKARYAHIAGDLELMAELTEKLWRNRLSRGTIDFSFSEAKILLDEAGKPIEIKVEELTIANKIIEEFMIACNEAVAERMYWADTAFIFRTHGKPDPEKIMAFKIFAGNLGFTLKTKDGGVNPKELQAVVLEAKGSKYEKVINTVMLRSMAKAKYTRANIGHYGLSSEHYCHFTSPIRRYPDLMIHRLIKLAVSGRLSGSTEKMYERVMPGICGHCSDRERAADEAERETENLKKVEYMKQFEGKKFEGVISNVTPFGMFVELDNTVEGLVRFSDMHDDYYEFIEDNYCLVGEKTGKTYRIGDIVKVFLARANVEARQIDFALLNKPGFAKRKHSRAAVYDDFDF